MFDRSRRSFGFAAPVLKMGAKKKGGLANRLARMSDEDRAKYLQRKADVEEEARRRKEQLVATFMKVQVWGFARSLFANVDF